MGGRGSSSLRGSAGISTEDFANQIDFYVGGGYASISDALTPQALRHMQKLMTYTDKTLYRAEESRFTADKLKKGSTFTFEDNYRSFSSKKSVVTDAIDEGYMGNSPAVFVMRGKKKSFDVYNHYKNDYYESQAEHFVGGKYKVTDKKKKNGTTYVYIEQQ